MTAVPRRVHEVLAAVAPDTEPPPHTVSAYGMQLHAATTVDGRDRR